MHPLNLIRFAPAEGTRMASALLCSLAQVDTTSTSYQMGRIVGVLIWGIKKLGIIRDKR
jgi:hypothetical protein